MMKRKMMRRERMRRERMRRERMRRERMRRERMRRERMRRERMRRERMRRERMRREMMKREREIVIYSKVPFIAQLLEPCHSTPHTDQWPDVLFHICVPLCLSVLVLPEVFLSTSQSLSACLKCL